MVYIPQQSRHSTPKLQREGWSVEFRRRLNTGAILPLATLFVVLSIYAHLGAAQGDLLKQCFCDTPVSGPVDDCCCDLAAVDKINRHIAPSLFYVLDTTFFRYFRINMYRECPFWSDEGMCMNPACGVATCTPDEIPECWKCNSAERLSVIDRRTSLSDHSSTEDLEALWVEDHSDFDPEAEWINLKLNPERFTGYSGPSAAQVWSAIYNENCFDTDNECLESRVFYRLISGLHASITTHISLNYYNDETDSWELNYPHFVAGVGKYPERINNLYFTYLFVMRALVRASPLLQQHDFDVGQIAESEAIKAAMASLIDCTSDVLESTCPVTFDETLMFQDANADTIKREFARHFKNISRIMDCVGCDKCRLWGTLQTMGLGTAIRILFSDEESLVLRRNEMVALINLLGRLSESVEGVELFRNMEVKTKLYHYVMSIGFAVGLPLVMWNVLKWLRRRRKRRSAPTDASASDGDTNTATGAPLVEAAKPSESANGSSDGNTSSEAHPAGHSSDSGGKQNGSRNRDRATANEAVVGGVEQTAATDSTNTAGVGTQVDASAARSGSTRDTGVGGPPSNESTSGPSSDNSAVAAAREVEEGSVAVQTTSLEGKRASGRDSGGSEEEDSDYDCDRDPEGDPVIGDDDI